MEATVTKGRPEDHKWEGGDWPSTVTLRGNASLVVVLATSHGGGRVVARILRDAGLGSTKMLDRTLEAGAFVHVRNHSKAKGDHWPPLEILKERLDTLPKPGFLKSNSAMYYVDELEKVTKPLYVHVVADGRDALFKAWGINASFNLVIPSLASISGRGIEKIRKAEWWQKSHFGAIAHAPIGRYLIVRLEDIIERPHELATQICGFVGIEPYGNLDWILKPDTVGQYKTEKKGLNPAGKTEYRKALEHMQLGLKLFGYL